MDRAIWRRISEVVGQVDRQWPRLCHRCRYSDGLIVRLFVWAVWHDRPRYWACQREHLGGPFRPRRLPSASQFCRRLHSPRVQQVLAEVNRRLAVRERPAQEVMLDGKALPISESSRDPDARTGRGNGRFSRGYKLHALVAEDRRVLAFVVRPMNEHELPVAQAKLVEHIPPRALALADGNYDSDKLYRAVDGRGAQLFTPLKGKRAESKNRLRSMSPARRQVWQDWGQTPELSRLLYSNRIVVEQTFSALSGFAGGLGPLPSWVRRLVRVRQWVTAKLIVYHARLLLNQAA